MIKYVASAAFLLVGTPAFTQQPAFDLVGEVNILSDYRFRGVSRSDEDPAVQGALTLFHGSGLYAGTRISSLRGVDPWRGRDLGNAQVDLYAGYRTALGGGFELDAGGTYYVFAGGNGATDYVEASAALTYQIGPAQLSGGARYTPAQAAIGDEDMLYLYGRAEVSIPFRPWSLAAEAGRQQSSAYGDYWTWRLGARHQLQLASLPDTEIGLDYVDTDLPSAPGVDGGLVASIRFGF